MTGVIYDGLLIFRAKEFHLGFRYLKDFISKQSKWDDRSPEYGFLHAGSYWLILK